MFQVSLKMKFFHKMNKSSLAPNLKKGDSVKTPEIESEYLTPNKLYTVKKVFVDGSFLIKDDDGKNLFCRVLECGHLDGQDWILND